jgi:selenide,water dikinase
VEEKIRLTQMVKTAGCAAKLFPNLLNECLKGIEWNTNENVIVGFEGKDDAGVYKFDDNNFLIHTTDFFTPVVDDPYTFGQIAATNSLSDIYAMGGKPISALNIVAFPQTENLEILKEILRGGHYKSSEANCVILGGHSVDIPNILYGLAVTGTINPTNLKTNKNAKVGDVLILTKALGTGLLNNCIKYSKIDKQVYKNLIQSMTRLNCSAAEAMVSLKANACTDITGFGLAGHSYQMAVASKMVLHILVNKIPLLDGAIEAVNQNMLTRGDKSNRDYTKNYTKCIGEVNTDFEHILYDPQTSGGLLISIPEKNSITLLKRLKENGDEYSAIIGFVENIYENESDLRIIFDYN